MFLSSKILVWKINFQISSVVGGLKVWENDLLLYIICLKRCRNNHEFMVLFVTQLLYIYIYYRFYLTKHNHHFSLLENLKIIICWDCEIGWNKTTYIFNTRFCLCFLPSLKYFYLWVFTGKSSTFLANKIVCVIMSIADLSQECYLPR